MNPNTTPPRDIFIDEIFRAAQANRKIVFLSADLGAASLDRFRDELPDQFIHAGISEQNMIDVSAGLAKSGRIVYAYAMACFVTCRCYEQIKVSLAVNGLPVNLVGIGAGYSYDDAGPTHYATEDVSCMRGLGPLEVYSASDAWSTLAMAKMSHTRPGLRYIRLDREATPPAYIENDPRLTAGLAEIDRGQRVCIVSNGYMLHRARRVRELLAPEGIVPGVIDISRIKPLNAAALAQIMQRYEYVVTLEEHFLSGGLGSAVAEALADQGVIRPIARLGIADTYYFENGGREHLHRLSKIDVESVAARVRSLLAKELEREAA